MRERSSGWAGASRAVRTDIFFLSTAGGARAKGKQETKGETTAVEAERVKRLIDEGMKPELAQAEVLDDEVRDQVERELASQEDEQ